MATHQIGSALPTGDTLRCLDVVGSTASLCCAVHCIALPLVITLLPVLGLGFLSSEGFEWGMIAVSITLATLALCWGRRVHGNSRTLYAIPVAVLLFIFAQTFHGDGHWICMALGGTALAAGHLLNRRLCCKCSHCKAAP